MSWGRINLKDFKRLQERINKLSAHDMDSLCRDAAKQLASRLLRKAKLRTPVDTGYLRNSWDCDFNVVYRGGEYRITVYNATEYAIYVEFGHRTRGGNGWVEGRFMMTRSEIELQSQAPKILENMLIKKLGEALNGK